MKRNVKPEVLTGWGMLIDDATRQIEAAKQRIALLKKARRSLEQLRDDGQPWPGNPLKIAHKHPESAYGGFCAERVKCAKPPPSPPIYWNLHVSGKFRK